MRGKYIGVSKNGGKTPKMDGEIRVNPIKMDDLGENPLFLETPISRWPSFCPAHLAAPTKNGCVEFSGWFFKLKEFSIFQANKIRT